MGGTPSERYQRIRVRQLPHTMSGIEHFQLFVSYCTMDHPDFIVCSFMDNSIVLKGLI